MSGATDILQAAGAVIGAPASVITAVMLWLQWKDRRAEWLPGVEIDIHKNRSQRMYRPDTDGKTRMEILVHFINETQRSIVMDSVSIKAPNDLRLIFNDGNGDIDTDPVRVNQDIPPGDTDIRLDAYSIGDLSGREVTLVFEISRKSRDRRPRSLTVTSIIH
ncbi:hypothetical protein [Acetobacter sp. LMG 32666]|uniref:hypothetical protein n=1 Tax=Acetobacter sp. LMG 32666 TaxID=2959295 RepID=UPI0030C86A7A